MAVTVHLLQDIVQGLVHTTQQEFENGGFTLKTHQMFTVHATPEETRIIVMPSFSKSSVFKMFSVRKAKPVFSNFPRFEERFSKSSVFVTD